MSRRGPAALFGVVLALLATAAVALAYFAASVSSGSATSPTGTMTAPAISTPATSNGSTTVTWTQQAALSDSSKNAGITYVVERRLGSGSYAAVSTGPCAGSLPHGTTSCTDVVAANGTYSYRVVAKYRTWTAASNASSVTATVDAVAPSASSSVSPVTPASGWYKTSPVSVTLSATDNAGGSGVKEIRYTTDGSSPSATAGTVYAAPFNVSATTTVKYVAIDNAGNVESPANSRTIQIDAQAPTNNLSLTELTGNSYLSGSTVYYRGNSAGSFRLSNAATDQGGSGLASGAYTAPAGSTSGWSPLTASATTGTGPYQATYSWANNTTSSPTVTASATDAAGNKADTALTFTNDTAAPTSSASQDPAPNAAGWNRTAVQLTLSADDAAGSGVKEIRYTTNGSNPTATSPLYTGVITVSATTTVKFFAVDRVGNSELNKFKTHQVNIDTVAPTASAVATNNKNRNTAGKIENGDSIALTYTETIDPNSILPGWSGTGNGTPIYVRFTDNGANDTATFYNAANSAEINLGSIALGGDYVPASGAMFAANMDQSGAVINIVLGTMASGGAVNSTAVASSTVRWTPSASATDIAGNPAATTAVTSTAQQF